MSKNMEQKQSVISILRALLISNGKKNGTPLRELKYDYCLREGKNEIPSFGHKSLVDFLISSGEFIINVETSGLIMVRVKPKSLSLLLKKPCSSRAEAVTNVALQSVEKKLPVNVTMKKPSSVFTFDQLNDSLSSSVMTTTITPLQQKEVAQEQPEALERMTAGGMQEKFKCPASSQAMSDPKLAAGSTSCIKTTALNGDGRSTTDKYEDCFSTVNNLCINLKKSLTCDTQNNYTAMLQIDDVKYFGKGKNSYEANENAARKYLQSIDIAIHGKLMMCRKSIKNEALNSSFIKLNQMRGDELHYLTIIRRDDADDNNMFKTVIQVDSVNYYGTGKSIQLAANNAAETCLQSIKRGIHDELVSGI